MGSSTRPRATLPNSSKGETTTSPSASTRNTVVSACSSIPSLVTRPRTSSVVRPAASSTSSASRSSARDQAPHPSASSVPHSRNVSRLPSERCEDSAIRSQARPVSSLASAPDHSTNAARPASRGSSEFGPGGADVVAVDAGGRCVVAVVVAAVVAVRGGVPASSGSCVSVLQPEATKMATTRTRSAVWEVDRMRHQRAGCDEPGQSARYPNARPGPNASTAPHRAVVARLRGLRWARWESNPRPSD